MISDLGLNIKKARQTRKISAYELSKRANVGNATISQIESGKRQTLKGDTLSKIANALNVSVNELLGTAETTKFETNDLLDLLNIMAYADFIELDGKTLNHDEKVIIESAIMLGVNTIRYNRLNKK
ncbi:helix-turn-helix transcriptional regulator [Clostridium botulinum]|nr:helix-turn-helix transcriptional regulator [Clostridium botulinum]NFL41779.1 helix-turn-helix transcriptional regulator [Clostridium botulinum]NFN20776.1 helix-turn-helix transcriptional regulator [Clostridium botulinum]NFN41994.1 helix-turn-helix transcriptional regulator [Clostridium botulinum]NFO40884.1 helix-turn-helix transcriptional regulator [Clostridium botulinum]